MYRQAWNYSSLAVVGAHRYYNSPLRVLVYCVLQTSVRGQVPDHEREDAVTARLWKAERLKVRMCNHVKTDVRGACASIIPALFCYAQVHRELQRATELLKESEDSRESLVQEVCLPL